ncbi:hypothetical protein QJS10_CPB12g01829 [Acorus calamus]|uniref:Myb/SANT-like DNA-binding domain-containing protein n=1 Tax=Acorus calamus TaxID=4465 RepID=A0AAV9DJY5_ACOCL|nr:hypothetical protein QJS10_CPB12g01829 [Acorus calamus]
MPLRHVSSLSPPTCPLSRISTDAVSSPPHRHFSFLTTLFLFNQNLRPPQNSAVGRNPNHPFLHDPIAPPPDPPMDDDDDAISAPNGRITAAASQPVTVAAPPTHHHHALALALPIQQPRVAGGLPTATPAGGGREDCWSEGATSVLIDAWGERYMELSRGNLKQQHWREVSDIVSSRDDYTKPHKTDVQCKNRIDTLKKKYKVEKAKIASGGGPSKWPFFLRIDRLIGSSPHNAKTPLAASLLLRSRRRSPLQGRSFSTLSGTRRRRRCRCRCRLRRW